MPKNVLQMSLLGLQYLFLVLNNNAFTHWWKKEVFYVAPKSYLQALLGLQFFFGIYQKGII
jgi:hypothetical protein